MRSNRFSLKQLIARLEESNLEIHEALTELFPGMEQTDLKDHEEAEILSQIFKCKECGIWQPEYEMSSTPCTCQSCSPDSFAGYFDEN